MGAAAPCADELEIVAGARLALVSMRQKFLSLRGDVLAARAAAGAPGAQAFEV